jgi:DNA-directed RNA polymerase specialized sigma24 family protein
MSRQLEARDELRTLGFDALGERSQACLVATEVMGLRYQAAADLLGLSSDEQVRQLRSRALAKLRS